MRAVCINCIDGRVQIPVIQWIQNNYKVDYVDMITEPGVDGLISGHNNPVEDIYRKVRLSIEKNNSTLIFLVGHHDCKANPVKDSEHRQHIQLGSTRLQKDFPELRNIGLWVNEKWQVQLEDTRRNPN